MVDPIGTPLAVVSLTFQVFSGCVAGYQLLSDANDMPQKYQFLSVRLKTEQHRLLDWAKVAGISEKDDTLSKSVSGLNRQLLLDILHQKEWLLSSFGRLDIQYKPLSKPLLCEEEPPEYIEKQISRMDSFKTRFPGSNPFLSKSLDFIEKTRRYPKKLKWAMFDNKSFEDLLSKLTSFNDFMKGMLDVQQQQILRHTQQETQLQILQLNNKIDYLVQIIEAAAIKPYAKTQLGLTADPAQAFAQTLDITLNINGVGSSHEGDNLANLARFKGLNLAIDQDELNEDTAKRLQFSPDAKVSGDPRLEKERFKLISKEKRAQVPHNREEAEYEGRRVWVEWKDYDPETVDERDVPPDYIAKRVRQLAILLHDEKKPSEFRAPRCLGYFDDHSNDCTRFALVFEKPADVPQDLSPVSLVDLFITTTPSLTERIALARSITDCIRYLHSTNWLHKGLRSHNILFFATSSGTYDFSKPYLAGFDYARPAKSEEMTERPPENPEYDVYRHPSTHGDGPTESYKKPFDIYSLGIILCEIAHWTSIDKIIGIADLSKAKPDKTKGVQKTLMADQGGHLGKIQFNMGDFYLEAVKLCLSGDFGLGKPLKDYVEEVDGSLLQGAFYEKVVQRLGGIVTGM